MCWLHKLRPQQKAPSLAIWKGKTNKHLIIALHSLQKEPHAKAASMQPTADIENETKHTCEHWLVVIQKTQVTSVKFYAIKIITPFLCMKIWFYVTGVNFFLFCRHRWLKSGLHKLAKQRELKAVSLSSIISFQNLFSDNRGNVFRLCRVFLVLTEDYLALLPALWPSQADATESISPPQVAVSSAQSCLFQSLGDNGMWGVNICLHVEMGSPSSF